MPEISDIVVADATPTNHTFAPLMATMAKSEWIEGSAHTYEGNGRVIMSMKPPTSQRPTTRNLINLYIPVEREVDGVYVVNDVIQFSVDHVIAKTVTDAEALQAYTIFKNLMATAIAQSYFAGRKPAY